MKTTNLFVELIIIGIGFTIALILTALCFDMIKLSQLLKLKELDAVIILSLGLALIYPLGIVADRLADVLFEWHKTKIQKGIYPERNQILKDKAILFTESNPLVDMILYGRSRMRICRGWVFNLLLLIPLVNWYFLKTGIQNTKTYIITNLFLILLGVLFYFSWRILTKSEYHKLKELGEITRNKLEV